MKFFLKRFSNLIEVLGNAFCVLLHTLICICYITLLYMLINKFTTGFSGEKVPKTPVVLKMAIQFRTKK